MYRTCSLKARQAADDLFAQALSENSAWAEDQPSLHDVLERDNALADRIVRYMRLFRKNELEKSEIRTVAGLGEPQADGNVTVTFTVPGTVSASDLLFGVATRNMRQTFASVLPGTLLWEEGVWKAAFSRDDLKETLPASGEHLFCLCGRTSQGPFAALWTETMGAKATAEAE